MPRRSLRLSTLLPLSLALLVIVTAIPTILVGYTLSSRVTYGLLLQRAETVMDGLDAEVRRLLDPVQDQMAQARRVVAEGIVNPMDEAELRTFMHGLMAGTPQVFGIGWIRTDGTMRRWERVSLGEFEEPLERLPFTRQAVADARAGQTSVWAAPFVSQALDDVILNYRIAVERDGQLLGLLGVGVTGAGLSSYVEDVSDRYDVTAFVLTGRDRVIAYPGRGPVRAIPGETDPPRVEDSDDPVVAGIWRNWEETLETDEAGAMSGHVARVDDTYYVYFYQEVAGYGPDPMTLVVASPAADTASARNASNIAAAIGLVLAGLAASAAWWLGRKVARPVGALDAALGSMSALDFANARLDPMERSRIREWHSIAERVADTSATLEKLSTYVPRALTRRLLDLPGRAAKPEERDVTVMFLDMEGFTPFAAARSAEETAQHLATLFAVAGPVIEAHDGVIDKYTGDGLMAFWGAPAAQPDHAAQSLRAAIALTRCLPPALGDGPRIRIGLHSGRALVGDIGFEGRVDYTLTGDTVNMAQRTEAALRGLAPEDPVVLGATMAVLDRIDDLPPEVREQPLEGTPLPAYLLPCDVLDMISPRN